MIGMCTTKQRTAIVCFVTVHDPEHMHNMYPEGSIKMAQDENLLRHSSHSFLVITAESSQKHGIWHNGGGSTYRGRTSWHLEAKSIPKWLHHTRGTRPRAAVIKRAAVVMSIIRSDGKGRLWEERKMSGSRCSNVAGMTLAIARIILRLMLIRRWFVMGLRPVLTVKVGIGWWRTVWIRRIIMRITLTMIGRVGLGVALVLGAVFVRLITKIVIWRRSPATRGSTCFPAIWMRRTDINGCGRLVRIPIRV